MSGCLRRRDVFLKIERLGGYSPLAPVAGSRRYGRDAMYGMGHEVGRIQPTEIAATTVDALVYREYLDDHYTTPNTAKLVEADVNEPPWYRRLPVPWCTPSRASRDTSTCSMATMTATACTSMG